MGKVAWDASRGSIATLSNKATERFNHRVRAIEDHETILNRDADIAQLKELVKLYEEATGLSRSDMLDQHHRKILDQSPVLVTPAVHAQP